MFRSISSALYLACSWFWCLGAFFPLLLVTDYGRTSLVYFFVLNIVGAVAFGFVWQQKRRRNFLMQYAPLARTFSLVVICYHVTFAVWVAVLLTNIVVLFCFMVTVATFWMFRDQLFSISIVLFIVTILLFGVTLKEAAPPLDIPQTSHDTIHIVLPLSLGFGLSPYLDLTFHRVFDRSARPRLVFSLGLGLAFGILLLGTFLTLPTLGLLLASPTPVALPLMALVAILVLQGGFTVAAHLREFSPLKPSTYEISIAAVTIAVPAITLVVAEAASPGMQIILGLILYKSFIFVIGGLLPLFVLFRKQHSYIAIGTLVLLPCYILGFLVGGEWTYFLSVGMAALAILLLIQGICTQRKVPGL